MTDWALTRAAVLEVCGEQGGQPSRLLGRQQPCPASPPGPRRSSVYLSPPVLAEVLQGRDSQGNAEGSRTHLSPQWGIKQAAEPRQGWTECFSVLQTSGSEPRLTTQPP